jgi:hypothetical protein
LSSGFPHHQNHAVPQPGQPTHAEKLLGQEALSGEQFGEGASAPEFDVAAMPESCVVMVPFASQRESQIF